MQVWRKDGVAYAGALFTHNGSLWQCLPDTGQTPGGPHWVCVARGADAVAAPTVSLSAPNRGNEVKALRAEFAAGFEKASGDLTDLEMRVTSLQAVDRQRLVQIEDSVGQIRAEGRAEAHAELEARYAEQGRSFEARLAASERRVDASEAQATKLKAELIELQRRRAIPSLG